MYLENFQSLRIYLADLCVLRINFHQKEMKHLKNAMYTIGRNRGNEWGITSSVSKYHHKVI